MSTTEQDIDIAEKQGKERGLSGAPLAENPYSMAQGSTTRVLGIAWRRGWLEGKAIRLEDSNLHAGNPA